MAQAIHARLDAPLQFEKRATASAPARPPAALAELRLAIHEDLDSIAADWRAFERTADGTVFQTVEFLSAWERHIGAGRGVRPAIVSVRDASGAMLCLFPLSVVPGRFVRELQWFGSDLCDYNGPLLAPAFALHVDGASFTALWREILRCLQQHPRLAFDLVNLSKMPEKVGGQGNPMLQLGVTANPSGAYLTQLSGDWESFYAAKRSSTTRRRDRTKRKRLGEMGAVQMVTVEGAELAPTLDTLMAQKTRAFARMGVSDLFANEGYPQFYHALAAEAATRPLTHVSRLDVGATPAAINLGLIWRGCYYHLLASYDDGPVSRFGPGAAHLHELMRYAIEQGCTVFDFTIGDEPYKRDWCDTEVTLYDHISAASWRGAIAARVMLAKQKLKRHIKQTPALWALAQRARSLAAAARGGTKEC
jgi:CelD/BcsL family acetyltransferase involved in cellulose biosynthesis